MLGVTISTHGNVVILCLRGKIVIGKTSILRKVVEAQTKSCVIMLDLSRVTAIDAHGLGVLLELRQHAESTGIEFRLMNVTKLVGRVLEITRLNSVFNIAAEAEVLPAPATQVSSLRRLSACA
jgi:anti-sigma B factor antagonist